MEEIEVVIRTFIPSKEITVPVRAKGDARRAGEKPTERDVYRTEIRVTIETDPSRNHGNVLVRRSRDTGTSYMYTNEVDARGNPTGKTITSTGKASGDSLQAEPSRHYQPGGGVPFVQIDVTGNEKFPLTSPSLTPGIKFDFSIALHPDAYDASGREIPATINGGVAVFPETEILVRREGSQEYQLIYDHPPSGVTKTPLDLKTQDAEQVTKEVRIKP